MARRHRPRTSRPGRSRPRVAARADARRSRRLGAGYAWPRGYAVRRKSATIVTMSSWSMDEQRCAVGHSYTLVASDRSAAYRCDVSARYIEPPVRGTRGVAAMLDL